MANFWSAQDEIDLLRALEQSLRVQHPNSHSLYASVAEHHNAQHHTTRTVNSSESKLRRLWSKHKDDTMSAWVAVIDAAVNIAPQERDARISQSIQSIIAKLDASEARTKPIPRCARCRQANSKVRCSELPLSVVADSDAETLPSQRPSCQRACRATTRAQSSEEAPRER